MLVASLPPLPVGGAERQALLLARTLKEAGISIIFLTPGQTGLKTEDSIDGIRVFRIHSIWNRLFEFVSGMKKKSGISLVRIEYDDQLEITNRITRKVGWPTVIFYRLFIWKAKWMIRKKSIHFDIVHAHTMEWSAIVAARLGAFFGKPVLIKDSTMNGFESLERFPHGKELQQFIVERSHFVAMTHSIEENLKSAGVPASGITRIPNGIPTTVPVVRQADENLVLFVGNLYQQPAKGIDILLKAWKSVIVEFPSARLFIAGKGDLGEYERYIESLGISGRVQLLGACEEIGEWYQKAALFVLPSRREGMSNALMEAMLHGLPCIATAISGNVDLIEDGVNGRLVPPANVDSLATAIISLLSDSHTSKALGEAARQTILTHYDIRKIAGKYQALYQAVLEGRQLQSIG